MKVHVLQECFTNDPSILHGVFDGTYAASEHVKTLAQGSFTDNEVNHNLNSNTLVNHVFYKVSKSHWFELIEFELVC